MKPYDNVLIFDQRITERRSSKSNASSIEEVSWYHHDISRTAVEIVLLTADIRDGTYLLRRSQRHPGYTVSVKCTGSVKHFLLSINEQTQTYTFGNASFYTLKELLDHFESCPILTRENDIPVTLINPLEYDSPEPDDYVFPVGHGEAGRNTFKKTTVTCHVGSKSGYLHKRGQIRTNWKKRWFVIEKKSFKYFHNMMVKEPIRDLDFSEATSVSEVTIDDKKNCFQLVFPERTFYLFGSSPLEAKQWIDFFKWKIEYFQSQKQE